MTEPDWLAGTDPSAMLAHALLGASPRKARLLAAAYWQCRAAWLPDSARLRAACDRAIAYADAPSATHQRRLLPQFIVSHDDISAALTLTMGTLLQPALEFPPAALTWYLREVFGNPFRPVKVKKDWLTSTVRALAKGIYRDEAFDRLPILADALQDAGCDSDTMLSHCRAAHAWEVPKGAPRYSEPAGAHVRGCWVVDVLLGKL